MTDQNKYLGKKRRKIFSIEKISHKRTPKNLTESNINLSPVNNLLSTKIKIDSTNYKFMEDLNEKYSSENQRHSLIGISKLVFEHLKQIESTTGNEVTEHIKKIFHTKKNDQFNEKNIQRRVYDAINVMCAAGLIKKNNKVIQFLKNKINQDNNFNNILNIKEKNEIKIEIKEKDDDFEDIAKEKTRELNEKRKILAKNFISLKFYEKIKILNESPQRKFQKKYDFPFDLIIHESSSKVRMTKKDDLTRILILSNHDFIHYSPYDIEKRLVSSDILSQINDNNLNNGNQIKSNSKKSTNDESLLEELYNHINLNNSINIDEQEEKKVEEQSNKIHIKDYRNINSLIQKDTKIANKKIINHNNKEQEKEELIIFNYLNNLKSFKDELIFNNSNNLVLNNSENNNINKDEMDMEKENDHSFIMFNKFRKNSNDSLISNSSCDNAIMKHNKGDGLSEIGLFTN